MHRTHTRLSVCLLYVAVALTAVVGQAAEAKAWFKVCNKTTKTIYYEHAIDDPSCSSPINKLRAKGWWTIAPNQCATVYSGSMSSRNFYYYAESTDRSLIWNGGSMWSVTYSAFDYCGVIGCVNCPAPPAGSRNLTHRSRKGTATNYTFNLTAS